MLKWLNGDVSDKGKIGITFGCMDLLHAGHVAMLAEANKIVITLLSDYRMIPQLIDLRKTSQFNLSLKDNFKSLHVDL